MKSSYMYAIPAQYKNTTDHTHDGIVVRCGGCTRYHLPSDVEPCKSCIKCRLSEDGSSGVSAFDPVDRSWYDELKRFTNEHREQFEEMAQDSLVGGWMTGGFDKVIRDMEKVCKMFGAEMPERFKKYADTADTKNVFIIAERAGLRRCDIDDQADHIRQLILIKR